MTFKEIKISRFKVNLKRILLMRLWYFDTHDKFICNLITAAGSWNSALYSELPLERCKMFVYPNIRLLVMT